jgi:pimeloyl-ACP methyl ester carboxylesterase
VTGPSPIVAIPGTLCDHRLFQPLETALGRTFHCVETHHASSITEAAANALREAPDRFVALGFSLGGWVALELLRLASDRVAAVILLSGNAFPDDPANHAERRASVEAARNSGMKAFVLDNLPRWAGGGALSSAATGASLISMAEHVGHDGHERQAEMNITRPDLLAVADHSKVPILLLAGADDQLCPIERYARTAAGPRARLVTLTGVGHFLPLEAPAVVAEAVEAFLKEIEQ